MAIWTVSSRSDALSVARLAVPARLLAPQSRRAIGGLDRRSAFWHANLARWRVRYRPFAVARRVLMDSLYSRAARSAEGFGSWYTWLLWSGSRLMGPSTGRSRAQWCGSFTTTRAGGRPRHAR